MKMTVKLKMLELRNKTVFNCHLFHFQVNITHSSQDTSSDEEDEQIEVQEVQFDMKDSESIMYEPSESDIVEETSLVEGADYDIIQVYAVDPNLDLEASSDDEDQENYTVTHNEEPDVEYIDDTQVHNSEHKTSDILQEELNIDLDIPIVSNVDEYFIKNDNKNILEVKDEPVVQDVDEYFIKVEPPVPNIDDFFLKHKAVEEESTQFRIDKPPSKPGELFQEDNKAKLPESKVNTQQNIEVPINESDLEVLPNIEDLKRFLMEDMPCSKFKNAQRSCSVPHSPINICMDTDDGKTCLSFEDLNLDLSDLTFDNDKDKSDTTANKSDDIPRTLTEEDVNSFLITNQPKTTQVKDEDDFSCQDMEIERPVESSISNIPSITISPVKRTCTSTPIPKPTVLEFCVEKTSLPNQIKKEVPEIKSELDDFIDVESCNDTVVPVLEANNLNSLLEQFEATEKLNTKKRPLSKTEDLKIKNISKNSLTNGMRLQDAGVQLNKNKMRQILVSIIFYFVYVFKLYQRTHYICNHDCRCRRQLTHLYGAHPVLFILIMTTARPKNGTAYPT
jgi:hypothetical protein